MKNRLGFWSPIGILVAALALVGLVAWTLTQGPTLFSPGPLNAVAKTETLGGVSTHAQLAGNCGACHTAPWSSQTMADRCMVCHQDVSAQIHDQSGLHGVLLAGSSSPTCHGCHTEHKGAAAPLTDFDHNKLTFKLTGKHATVPCAECHAQATTMKALQQTPQDCYSCHAKNDKHQGAFGQQCSQCHTTDNWANASFDHSKSDFPLTGAHAQVKCDQCHKNGDFKGTPADCGACHAQPSFHADAFGTQSTQCATCHTGTAWTPAQFNLTHDAIPTDHGAEGQTPSCKTCHPTNVSTYTCYGCHEHTEAQVQADHEGRSPAELVDCISCHPGGRKGD